MVKLPKQIVSARKLKQRKTGPVSPRKLQMSDDRKWRDGPSVLQLEEASTFDLAAKLGR
jgi:hypothetical protein